MNDHDELMDNPYPGLRPFQADETHLFFGRDEQRTELLGRLRKSRFLAVVGTSGSGKSSLVRAGLLPGLYGGFMAGGAGRWHIVDTRPGEDPIGRLAKALDSKGALRPDDEDDDISFTEAALRRTSLGLTNVVKEARLPEGERVLLLVDQFEELFRFVDTAKTNRSRDDASAFVKLLLAAAEQDDVPIYVVITMRSDFLGDCARFRDLPEAINDGQYLIPRLTRDQRREAITGPASVCGTRLSPTLVNRLLNDVGDTPDQLPILQHALMRTFDRWQVEHPDADTIDLDDYEDVGGMSHALSRHADAVFRGLGDNVDAEERRRRWHIAEKLFKCTTDVGKGGRKIRRLAKLKDIAAVAKVSVEEVATVIDAFRQKENSFLMPPVGEELQPGTYIDISHESLIRNWSRLSRWVDQEAESGEDYRLLAQKAELHRKGEEDLLGRQALRVANEWKEKQQPTSAWAERYGSGFESAMDFLAKSDATVTAQQAAQERRSRIRKAVIVGASIAVLTPLMMLLISAGEEAEWNAEREATRVEVLNGGADEQLFSFLKERIRRENNPALAAQEAGSGDYSQRYFEIFELTERLESNGALDHAEIVGKYTSWQSGRGEALLYAIWEMQLEPHVLNEALLSIGAYEEQLRDKDLDALLYAIEDGEIWVLPEYLGHALRPVFAMHHSGTKAAVDLDKQAKVHAADRWLDSVYREFADGKVTFEKYSKIKKAYRTEAYRAVDEFQRRHDIAEKLVFRKMQNRLRELACTPADNRELACKPVTPVDDLAIHLHELRDMLKVFGDLETSQVSEPDDTPAAANDREPVEEAVVVGIEGEQRTADREAQLQDSERRVFGSIVELTIEELEQRFDRAPAATNWSLTSGNFKEFDSRPVNAIEERNEAEQGRIAEQRNIALQRKIAFVWTVKKLIKTAELLEDEELQAQLSKNEEEREAVLSESEKDREELLEEIEEEREELLDEIGDELEEIVESAIFDSVGEDKAAPFTLWRLRDNQLYRTLQENDKFKIVKQTIVDLYGVFFFGLLWFVWSGLRRHRTRKGKIFASHVGMFRLGLASLADVSVAIIAGLIAALTAASFGALVLAIGLDTFDFTDDVMVASIAVAVAVAIAYLLFRDVMHFRYRRSFGKILFEFRPIDTEGDSLSRGASFRRNWMIVIGIVLTVIVVSISITALVVMSENLLSSLEVREMLYLSLAIVFIESIFFLGLFERLGGRWSKTTVIDTRSNESAIAGGSQAAGIALRPAST